MIMRRALNPHPLEKYERIVESGIIQDQKLIRHDLYPSKRR